MNSAQIVKLLECVNQAGLLKVYTVYYQFCLVNNMSESRENISLNPQSPRQQSVRCLVLSKHTQMLLN